MHVTSTRIDVWGDGGFFLSVRIFKTSRYKGNMNEVTAYNYHEVCYKITVVTEKNVTALRKLGISRRKLVFNLF